jgi:hypothetical protein
MRLEAFKYYYLPSKDLGVAGIALRANEDETSAHREFRLEGAEGSRKCLCPIQQESTLRLALPGMEATGRRW